MDHSKQTLPNGEKKQEKNKQAETWTVPKYEVPTTTKLGLTLLIIALSVISVLTKEWLIGSFCAVLAASTLAFTGIFTASPAYVFALLPALGLSVFPVLNTTALYMLIYCTVAAIALTKAIYQRKNKTVTTLYVTIALAIAMIATVSLSLWGKYGTNALNAFSQIYRGIFDEFYEFTVLWFEEMKKQFVAQGLSEKELASFEMVLTKANAKAIVDSAQAIAISVLGVLLMAISYIGVSFFAFVTKKRKADELLEADFCLRLKTPSAVIYIICLILPFFAPATSAVYLTTQNLMILLSPAFLAVGVREKIREYRNTKRVSLLTILFLLLLFIYPTFPILFFIFTGITATFAKNIKKKPKPDPKV